MDGVDWEGGGGGCCLNMNGKREEEYSVQMRVRVPAGGRVGRTCSWNNRP